MKHFVSLLNDSVKENWTSPAVTNFGGKTYTYGQMAEQIAKYHILFAEAGIKKGDKVALYARNSAEWVIAYFATLTYEAVSVPFLPDFIPAAVAELGTFSECKLLIVDDIAFNSLDADEKYIKQLESTPGFAGIINVKDISICVATEKALLTAHDNLDEHFAKLYPNGLSADLINYYPEERDMEAVVEISFTSGTTSATSKGVVLPARSLSVNLDFARREIPATRGGHIFAILPMAHMFGQTFDVLFPLAGGCHVFIMPGKPTPARLLEGLGTVKPFMFLTVPLVIEKIFKAKVFPATRTFPANMLLKVPGLDRIVLNKIKKSLLTAFGNGFTTGLILGGAALNREVEDLLKRMNFPYVVGYGMTECGPLISYCDKSEFVKYSCGKKADPLELRIDSANPRRILGEIQVKGDAVMLGYYKNTEATAATFTDDGWLKTGDMGIVDAKGNVFIKGRCKNMILTGNGQNIYPEEIEDKINNLPYVVESLVVGRKNAIVALVVADYEAGKKAGFDEQALDKLVNDSVLALNAELAAYSKIGYTEIRRDAFEKTPKQSIKRYMYS
ncbi:MAG: AMP-binding protein [Bacteroidaceae bacterium]|jgi:long-chain acyl-CoA synthetase|nr:AMP-binding protein [Bacteroidaceae bacterium]